MEVSRHAGPAEIPGWAVCMNETIELVLALLLTGIVWLAQTLLGLVVLGIGPATCAAADVQIALRDGEKARVVSRMWRTWREQLLRGNLRMVPLLVVQGAAGAILWTVSAGLSDGPLMLLVWAVVCSLLWPLALLLGASVSALLAVSVLSRRIRVLLEDLDRGAAARAVPGADQAASQSAAPGATPAREG